MSSRCSLVVLACFLASVLYAQVPLNSSAAGVVSGTLHTYDGKPASGYTVDLVGTSQTSAARARTQTDKDGLFSVENLRLGEYVIAPYLEGLISRYPGGTSSFYDFNPVRIRLTASESSKQITIRLSPPNRILSGTVSSNVNGSPISATIQIEYPSDPDRFIRFASADSGEFKVLIPAKTQLIVRTTAPGYVANSQLLGPIPEDVDPRLDIKLISTGTR